MRRAAWLLGQVLFAVTVLALCYLPVLLIQLRDWLVRFGGLHVDQ